MLSSVCLKCSSCLSSIYLYIYVCLLYIRLCLLHTFVYIFLCFATFWSICEDWQVMYSLLKFITQIQCMPLFRAFAFREGLKRCFFKELFLNRSSPSSAHLGFFFTFLVSRFRTLYLIAFLDVFGTKKKGEKISQQS